MSDQNHRPDDYLPCERYLNGEYDEHGFNRFSENDKFYFSFLENGNVILRSEGYGTEAARENGIASVKTNMTEDKNYQTRLLPDGKWVLSLKAANHQEIARSCVVEAEEEAKAFLPSERIKAAALAVQKAATSANEADDYMICREYEEKIGSVSDKYSDFITFHHENTNKYYFAWINPKKEIILRSEGYPTTAARDNGLESVRKNRDIRERFKVIESHGAYFLTLKAGNHQEIGRSCPRNSEAELWALLNSASAAATVQDDYLPCSRYKAHNKSFTAGHKDFISFQDEETKLYYFAWINTDGDIILRSEGYQSAASRDNGIESVIKNRDIKERFKVEEHDGEKYLILKAGNHQEIGRSCPGSSESALWALLAPAAVVAASAVVPPVAAAAVAAAVAATAPKVVPPPPVAAAAPVAGKSGFNWWWLLPLLLLGLLFLLWRSCQNKATDAAAPVETTAVAEPAQPTEAPAPAPPAEVPAETAAAAAIACDLNSILFGFDRSDLTATAKSELDKMSGLLKSNQEYKGDLKAYTDSKGSDEYNRELSLRRANAAKEYLVSTGIDAGRIATGAVGNSDPVATNTEDDSGRKFNRRVELKVVDKAGNDLCKSISKDLPEQLKTK